MQDVFCNIKTFDIDDNEFFRLKNGLTVNTELKDETNIFIVYKAELLGVAEVYDGNIKLKTYLLED